MFINRNILSDLRWIGIYAQDKMWTYAISCGPLIQMIHTNKHFSCFWAHHSALFIGEYLLACWLKLEREQVCWSQLNYICRRHFPVLFFIQEGGIYSSADQPFLLFSIIYRGSLSVWTVYNSLSCHCHALCCIFFCVLIHFFTCIIDNKFSFLILKK